MIKRLLRRMGTAKLFFSTAQQITDWEYVAKIHKSLKQNNVNQAMKYLINSHLDGIILDRQTFYNMHLKMTQLKAALSYQQLAYKIYRESFSPHILMKQWMKLLSQTKDKKCSEMLKNDYQSLNLDIPAILIQNIKSRQKQSSSPLNNQKTDNQAIIPVKQTHGRKKVANVKNDKKEQIRIEPFGMRKLNDELKNIQQISRVLNSTQWKITIYDLEINFDNAEQEQSGSKLTNNRTVHDRDFIPNQLDLMEALMIATKVKIGKIEISQNKNPFKPDQ